MRWTQDNPWIYIAWFLRLWPALLFSSQSCLTFCDLMCHMQHTKLPCSSLSPGVCSNSCPLNWWCQPTISSSVISFSSCPQSLPASESFPMSHLFPSGGQSIGASASTSVLSINSQGWFPLGLMVWSPCCPVDSQESSPAQQFESISSLALSLLYGPTLTSIHDWKNHSFDHTDLYQQSDVSAF